MKKNLLSAVVFTLLCLIIPSAHALMIRADPAIINPIKIGDTFNLNVNVENAADLGEFRFDLIYNTDIVTVTNVIFSNFLETPERTVSFNIADQEIPGRLSCLLSTKGTGVGASGNGTLVTITFRVESLNNDFLNIENAHLINTKNVELPASLPVGSKICYLGDVDGSGAIDLTDAILGLRILAGINISPRTITLCADVNHDNKIGIEEVIYILQYLSKLRE
jgi:hypothetical protein